MTLVKNAASFGQTVIMFRFATFVPGNCPRFITSSSASAKLFIGDEQQRQLEIAPRTEYLSKQFDCPVEDLKAFIIKNPNLYRMGWEKFKRVTSLFVEQGLTFKDIMSYPEVYKRKYETLQRRFQMLKKEGGLDKVRLTMINVTSSCFDRKHKKFQEQKKAEEKVKNMFGLLTKNLHSTDIEAEQIVTDCEILENSQLATIKKKVSLLLTNGVPATAILTTMSILAFPYDQLDQRLKLLAAEGVYYTSNKTIDASYMHLLRMNIDEVGKHVLKWKENKRILGKYSCKRDYLQYHLQIKRLDEFDILLKKNSVLLNVSLAKLESMLKFLIGECKYDPAAVCQYPRLLNQSVQTLRDRKEDVKGLGFKVSLRTLSLTKAKYALYLDSLTMYEDM